MTEHAPSRRRDSTVLKHRQLYDRYCELLLEAQQKLGGLPQMVYTSYFYQQLSEEYGYGIAYISTIINRERRRRDVEERRAKEKASERAAKLHELLGSDAN